jgi:DNA-binding transcriptional regulator YiaG
MARNSNHSEASLESPAPEEIKQRRLENDLSQVEAARMLPGVSVSTWRAWEYGQNPMHPSFWELFTLKLILDRKK